MTKKLTKAEEAQMTKIRTKNSIFELGKATQKQEMIKNNKLSFKSKLNDNFIPPKITNKNFSLTDDYDAIVNSVKDDQVYFTVRSYYDYKILSGGKTLEECVENKKKNIVSSNSTYIAVESWKTDFKNDEQTHTLYIRNEANNRTMSNSFTFHKQSLNEDLISDFNFNIVTLDKPLQIEDTESKFLSVIDIQRKPIKLTSIKELLLVDFFLREEINYLNKRVNELEINLNDFSDMIDAKDNELNENIETIKLKDRTIEENDKLLQLFFLKRNLVFTFLFVTNLFTLYSAIYGYDNLVSDSYTYILYPIESLFLNLVLFFTNVNIFILDNPYLLVVPLTYCMVRIVQYLFCTKTKKN